MSSQPLPRVSAESPEVVPSLHGRAMDNLRFIRETMEQAAFTAVSGWAMVAVGASALVAAGLAWASRDTAAGMRAWLSVWACEALLGLLVAGAAMWRKARANEAHLLRGPGRKMALSFAPPMFVGVVLTIALLRLGLVGLLPGVWLLLYGTGVVTGGSYSVLSVPVMGCCFVLLGSFALFAMPATGVSAAAFADLMMATGFGGLHIIFGIYIARRHGG